MKLVQVLVPTSHGKDFYPSTGRKNFTKRVFSAPGRPAVDGLSVRGTARGQRNVISF